MVEILRELIPGEKEGKRAAAESADSPLLRCHQQLLPQSPAALKGVNVAGEIGDER